MYSKEEYKQLKRDFWTGFYGYCSKNRRVLGLRQKPYFMLYDTKVKGVELKFDVRRDSVDVVFEVNGWGREEKWMKVVACRDVFVEAFGAMRGDVENLSEVVVEERYVRETGVEVSRVYVRLSDMDFHRREYWDGMYVFMTRGMKVMEGVFEEVREFI